MTLTNGLETTDWMNKKAESINNDEFGRKELVCSPVLGKGSSNPATWRWGNSLGTSRRKKFARSSSLELLLLCRWQRPSAGQPASRWRHPLSTQASLHNKRINHKGATSQPGTWIAMIVYISRYRHYKIYIDFCLVYRLPVIFVNLAERALHGAKRLARRHHRPVYATRSMGYSYKETTRASISCTSS